MKKIEKFELGIKSMGKCLSCLNNTEAYQLYRLFSIIGLDFEIYNSIVDSAEKELPKHYIKFGAHYIDSNFSYSVEGWACISTCLEPPDYPCFFKIIKKALIFKRKFRRIVLSAGWKNVSLGEFIDAYFYANGKASKNPVCKQLHEATRDQLEKVLSRIKKAKFKVLESNI